MSHPSKKKKRTSPLPLKIMGGSASRPMLPPADTVTDGPYDLRSMECVKAGEKEGGDPHRAV